MRDVNREVRIDMFCEVTIVQSVFVFVCPYRVHTCRAVVNGSQCCRTGYLPFANKYGLYFLQQYKQHSLEVMCKSCCCC